MTGAPIRAMQVVTAPAPRGIASALGSVAGFGVAPGSFVDIDAALIASLRRSVSTARASTPRRSIAASAATAA